MEGTVKNLHYCFETILNECHILFFDYSTLSKSVMRYMSTIYTLMIIQKTFLEV